MILCRKDDNSYHDNTIDNIHDNIIDRDMDQLHKISDEPHNEKSYGCCQDNLLKLYGSKTNSTNNTIIVEPIW